MFYIVSDFWCKPYSTKIEWDAAIEKLRNTIPNLITKEGNFAYMHEFD